MLHSGSPSMRLEVSDVVTAGYGACWYEVGVRWDIHQIIDDLEE